MPTSLSLRPSTRNASSNGCRSRTPRMKGDLISLEILEILRWISIIKQMDHAIRNSPKASSLQSSKTLTKWFGISESMLKVHQPKSYVLIKDKALVSYNNKFKANPSPILLFVPVSKRPWTSSPCPVPGTAWRPTSLGWLTGTLTTSCWGGTGR